MAGRIIKGIAGFYYVHIKGQGIYECKAKGIFRKEGMKPLVGDKVDIEILSEEDKEGNIIPKIKISENVEKITTPHFKKVYRLYSNETGKAMADLVTLFDEELDDTKPYTLFDPVHTWKKKTVENFTSVNILKPIFKTRKINIH